MTKGLLSKKEALAYQLGIIAESSMMLVEDKDKERIKLGSEYGLNEKAVMRFYSQLEKDSNKHFSKQFKGKKFLEKSIS